MRFGYFIPLFLAGAMGVSVADDVEFPGPTVITNLTVKAVVYDALPVSPALVGFRPFASLPLAERDVGAITFAALPVSPPCARQFAIAPLGRAAPVSSVMLVAWDLVAPVDGHAPLWETRAGRLYNAAHRALVEYGYESEEFHTAMAAYTEYHQRMIARKAVFREVVAQGSAVRIPRSGGHEKGCGPWMGRLEAVVGSGAALGASVAVAMPDSNTVDAIGRWPLTVVLGAVCCFCVWIIYKQGCKFGERLDKLWDAMKDLAKCLSERPCIRHKEND